MVNCKPSILGRNPYRHLVITITARSLYPPTGASISDVYEDRSKKPIRTFSLALRRSRLGWSCEILVLLIHQFLQLPLIANLLELIFYFDLILWNNPSHVLTLGFIRQGSYFGPLDTGGSISDVKYTSQWFVFKCPASTDSPHIFLIELQSVGRCKFIWGSRQGLIPIKLSER